MSNYIIIFITFNMIKKIGFSLAVLKFPNSSTLYASTPQNAKAVIRR